MINHRNECYCQNCISKRRATMWLYVGVVTLVVWLMCIFKPRANDLPKVLTKRLVMLDSDLRESVKQIKKKCPACQVYVNAGVMAGPQGEEIPVAFLFVRDQGTNYRVHRMKTERGMNVVTVYFPGQITDLELIKFVKGGIENE
jgi:hypothetical protein